MKNKSAKIITILTLMSCSPSLFALLNSHSITLPKPIEQSLANEAVETSHVTIDYTQIQLNQLTQDQIARYLGWVPKDTLHCYGYYQEAASLYTGQAGAYDEHPVKINADWSSLSQIDTSTFVGDVVITQPQRQISADKVLVYRDQNNGELQNATLLGNVYYREPGRLVVADKADINLQDKSGTLYHTLYRMLSLDFLKQKDSGNKASDSAQVQLYDQTAWGIADKVTRDKAGIIDIYDGTYTTCPPHHDFWTVKARHLNLNQDTGRGSATHAWLYVKDVPLLYAPYLNFPIDDQRKSGFLLPIIGSTTESGFTLATPFYWNMAPNYDATITPNYMEKRGLQLNGEFRYLTEGGLGNFHGSILPQDKAFTQFRDHLIDEFNTKTPLEQLRLEAAKDRLESFGNDRYLLSFNDVHRYTPNWHSYIYLNKVSDDYYFQDFDNDPMETTENQIYNVAELFYEDMHWNFVSRVEGYQTLHPYDQQPVANQYKKLPELILNGSYPETFANLAFQFNNSAVNFQRDHDVGAKFDLVTGSRVNINPAMSMPLYWLSGYLNPQIQLAATQYDLKNQNAVSQFLIDNTKNPVLIDELQSLFKSSHITRVLPLANLDTGLFFERGFTLFDTPYQQTLEPRLFYLYVPYTNQNDIPYFDTTLLPFNYDQLFRINRFTGIDRIGDANQVSLALTTRFLNDATGAEKIIASVGEIIYFKNRQVLTPGQIVHADNLITLNNPDPSAPVSPIASRLTYRINPAWNATGDYTWDPNESRTDNGTLTLQYAPDNRHILNLSYIYVKNGDPMLFSDPDDNVNNLYQTDISLIWPLFNNWSVATRWNYNISHSFTQNALAGIQYDNCCWAVRLMGGRQFDFQEVDYAERFSKPTFNNKIYLEFAFKGLARVSNKSPHQVLTESIRGYKDTFGE